MRHRFETISLVHFMVSATARLEKTFSHGGAKMSWNDHRTKSSNQFR